MWLINTFVGILLTTAGLAARDPLWFTLGLMNFGVAAVVYAIDKRRI